MSKMLKQLEKTITRENTTTRKAIKRLIEASAPVQQRAQLVESVTGLLGNIIYAIDKITTVASKSTMVHHDMDSSGQLNISSIAPLSMIADAAVLASALAQADLAKFPPELKTRLIQTFGAVENKNPSEDSISMLRNMVDHANSVSPQVGAMKAKWESTLQEALRALQQGDMRTYSQILLKVKNALAKLRTDSAAALETSQPQAPQATQQGNQFPQFR